MAVINRVPELVAKKFDVSVEDINLSEVQRGTGLNYATVSKWIKGRHERRIDTVALEAWCDYLDAEIGDILVRVPDKGKSKP